MRVSGEPVNCKAAANSYQEAIKIDAANALAYKRPGDIEADDGLLGKAAAYFARACDLDPQNPAYHASAGTAYLKQGAYNQATIHLR